LEFLVATSKAVPISQHELERKKQQHRALTEELTNIFKKANQRLEKALQTLDSQTIQPFVVSIATLTHPHSIFSLQIRPSFSNK
jgi:hypothetical protein